MKFCLYVVRVKLDACGVNMWGQIRKFGLDYCDLPTTLWNVSVMLRAMTLNIDNTYKKQIPIIFYIASIIFSACYFYVYLVSMVWFVFWKCRENGDRIAAMIVFSLGIASEIGTCKLFYMFLYKKNIQNIVNGYLTCNASLPKNSRFYKNLLRTMRDVKKRALLFWAVIIGNGIVYILKPIVTPGRHIMEDLFVLLGLEPTFESPNYEISFLLSAGGVVFTCFLPANITVFLIVIIGYTEATMLALSEELLHLWTDAQQYYNNIMLAGETNTDSENIDLDNDTFEINNSVTKDEIINSYIKNRLNKIIKIHATNINLIMQIEFVFRNAIAMEFVLLIAGLIAELLGGLENTYIEMPYALMQVGMDCFTGQRLMEASIKFENSVYDCKWENFNRANMNTVRFILRSAQKTLVVSAGGVTQLNFSSFMTVIRSIYSAYTALHSTMT